MLAGTVVEDEKGKIVAMGRWSATEPSSSTPAWRYCRAPGSSSQASGRTVVERLSARRFRDGRRPRPVLHAGSQRLVPRHRLWAGGGRHVAGIAPRPGPGAPRLAVPCQHRCQAGRSGPRLKKPRGGRGSAPMPLGVLHPGRLKRSYSVEMSVNSTPGKWIRKHGDVARIVDVPAASRYGHNGSFRDRPNAGRTAVPRRTGPPRLVLKPGQRGPRAGRLNFPGPPRRGPARGPSAPADWVALGLSNWAGHWPVRSGVCVETNCWVRSGRA